MSHFLASQHVRLRHSACAALMTFGLALVSPVSGALAVDQVTSRSLDELKNEIVDRAARKPQRSPAEKVKPADVQEAVAAIKTMDRDDWALGFMGPAERHFAEGRKLEAEGKIEQAREAFISAYRLFKIAHYPTNNSPQKQRA